MTKAVSKLDGVHHCDVSLLSNSMKVEFDQDKVNEQKNICEAVNRLAMELVCMAKRQRFVKMAASAKSSGIRSKKC